VTERLFDSTQSSFARDVWASASVLDSDALFAHAERHSTKPHFSMQTHMRYCDQSPLDLFERFGPHLMSIEARHSVEGGGGVARLRDDGRSLQGYVAIVPGSQSNVWLIATDMKASSEEYDRLLTPMLDRLSGRLLAGWMSTRELEESLLRLEQEAGCALAPGRVASKGYDRSSIEFLRHGSMSAVLEELRQRSLHLQSVDFKLLAADGREVLSGGVNKWYRVQYRGGASYAIRHYLLDALESRLVSHFAKVTVCHDTPNESRLTFKFDRDALMDRARHEKLVSVLSQMPRVSVCAFHMNPYLHVSVADYTDGSSVNLLSDAADRLFVIPGPRCTSGSVSRILDAIYNDFAPGMVAEEEDDKSEWAALMDTGR